MVFADKELYIIVCFGYLLGHRSRLFVRVFAHLFFRL